MKQIIIIGTGAVAAELTMYLRDIPDVVLKGYLEYDYNIKMQRKMASISSWKLRAWHKVK